MKHKDCKTIVVQPTTEDTAKTVKQVNAVAKRLRMRPMAAVRLIIETGHKTLMRRKVK